MDIPARIVVMGPSASGKSTVGAALAQAMGATFIDGDALHPPENVALMRAGTALADGHRWGWLDAVGGVLADAQPPGLVVACSALRHAYRDRIRAHAPDAWFVALDVSPALAQARASSRPDHFMPATLVASQMALLEPLEPDERGVTVDASLPVAAVVETAVASLG